MARPALPAVVSTNDNTCWAFVAGRAEPRHLSDIIFGVNALRSRGVPENRIWVFADHPAIHQHLNPYNIGNVFAARDLLARAPHLPNSDLFVVAVTGHGDRAGIPTEAGPSINATELLGAVRACPGVKGGIVILGQCYAGLFHYTEAGIDPAASHVCLIGATSLSLSLSVLLKLQAPLKHADGSDGLDEWMANVFFLRFFEWLLRPQDVDGNGRFTLVDAYKYASVLANDDLRGFKGEAHKAVAPLQSDIADLEKQVKAASGIAAVPLKLKMQATQQTLTEVLNILYVHQEPWILHALFAAGLEFPLPPAPVAVPAAPVAAAPSP